MSNSLNYTVVVPVPFYQLDENNAACESAFAEHLKMLQSYVKDYAEIVHLHVPSMKKVEYESRKSSLKVLNSKEDKILVTTSYPSQINRLKFFFTRVFSVYKQLKVLVRDSSVVHSGPSVDPFRPFEIIAIWLATKSKKISIFVVDIDERESAKLDYRRGRLSLKSYLLCKYIYDPFVDRQIKYAVENCDLVLLKGQQMVDDYGNNKPHVKTFYDTAFSSDDIISKDLLESKIALIGKKTLRLVYFGRLTEYKGILDMIKAVIIAKKDLPIEFSIIGDGEQLEELELYVKQNGAKKYIQFIPQQPYGPKLFNLLYEHDLLLATPQRQDTPRSVFDAMINGVITLAYDTYYYRDLVKSDAVIVSPWFDINAIAKSIIYIGKNPTIHKRMVKSAVDFASVNTQEQWLAKRQKWLRKCLD